MINKYLNLISSKKSQIIIFILLNICGFIFIFLPHNIFSNMIDLKLSYSIQDVYDSFNAMGAEGRLLNIYSTLILDTVYPVLYVSLMIGAYVKLFSKDSYLLFVPIMTGVFDLLENIQSVIMNLNYSKLDEFQVAIASLTTSLKWVLVILMISILVLGISKKKLSR